MVSKILSCFNFNKFYYSHMIEMKFGVCKSFPKIVVLHSLEPFSLGGSEELFGGNEI